MISANDPKPGDLGTAIEFAMMDIQQHVGVSRNMDSYGKRIKELMKVNEEHIKEFESHVEHKGKNCMLSKKVSIMIGAIGISAAILGIFSAIYGYIAPPTSSFAIPEACPVRSYYLTSTNRTDAIFMAECCPAVNNNTMSTTQTISTAFLAGYVLFTGIKDTMIRKRKVAKKNLEKAKQGLHNHKLQQAELLNSAKREAEKERLLRLQKQGEAILKYEASLEKVRHAKSDPSKALRRYRDSIKSFRDLKAVIKTDLTEADIAVPTAELLPKGTALGDAARRLSTLVALPRQSPKSPPRTAAEASLKATKACPEDEIERHEREYDEAVKKIEEAVQMHLNTIVVGGKKYTTQTREESIIRPSVITPEGPDSDDEADEKAEKATNSKPEKRSSVSTVSTAAVSEKRSSISAAEKSDDESRRNSVSTITVERRDSTFEGVPAADDGKKHVTFKEGGTPPKKDGKSKNKGITFKEVELESPTNNTTAADNIV